MGGMNFLFTVCLDIGLVVSTPIIIYQILRFLQPLMKDTTRRFLLWASGGAGLVAISGVLFGYFLGLPSALHFLLHQFTTVQVRPLITIQSYMQFVALYLLGCALMFQLPLIVLLINRIKPIGPKALFKYERHLIVGAVITAFIMNPSPNIVDQLFVVVPIIVSYQVSILMLWVIKRRGRPTHVDLLRRQDDERRAERTGQELTPLLGPPLAPAPMAMELIPIDDDVTLTPAAAGTAAGTDAIGLAPEPESAPAPVPDPAPEPRRAPAHRPRQYATQFTADPQRRNYAPLRRQLVQ